MEKMPKKETGMDPTLKDEIKTIIGAAAVAGSIVGGTGYLISETTPKHDTADQSKTEHIQANPDAEKLPHGAYVDKDKVIDSKNIGNPEEEHHDNMIHLGTGGLSVLQTGVDFLK